MHATGAVVGEGDRLAGKRQGGGQHLRQALRQVRPDALRQELVGVQPRQPLHTAAGHMQQYEASPWAASEPPRLLFTTGCVNIAQQFFGGRGRPKVRATQQVQPQE